MRYLLWFCLAVLVFAVPHLASFGFPLLAVGYLSCALPAALPCAPGYSWGCRLPVLALFGVGGLL